MTIYKLNKKGEYPNKEEQLEQAKSMVKKSDNTRAHSLKAAQNIILKDVLDQCNELDIPKKTIKTYTCGDVSLRLIANLAATGRTKEVIAKTLGMTPRNFIRLCKKHEEIDAAINMGSALLGGKAIEIMWGKIENNDDKNNNLLKIALEEYAGVGRKSIKVEHTGKDGDDIQVNVKTKHKSIMSKIFQKEQMEAIEAEFEEVGDDENDETEE